MTKLAVIVGGVVLMAGVALAGTLTSLGSADNPPAQTIAPLSTTTGTMQSGDRGRGAEPAEAGEEPNEDLRGPCDEAEHTNDVRCTGAAAPSGEEHSGHGEDDD